MGSPSLWLICLLIAVRYPTYPYQTIFRPDRVPSPKETDQSLGSKSITSWKRQQLSLLESPYSLGMGLNFPLVGPQPSPVFTECLIPRHGTPPDKAIDQG